MTAPLFLEKVLPPIHVLLVYNTNESTRGYGPPMMKKKIDFLSSPTYPLQSSVLIKYFVKEGGRG